MGFPDDDDTPGGQGPPSGPAQTETAEGGSSGSSEDPLADTSDETVYTPTAPGVVTDGPGGGGGSGGYVPDDTPSDESDEEEESSFVAESTYDAASFSADTAMSMYAETYKWREPGDPVDYNAIFEAATLSADQLFEEVNSPVETVVSSDCAVTEEEPPDPITGGTHYLYIENESVDAYSNYRTGTSGQVIGNIKNRERVYVYPELEFVGPENDWCKVKPIEGDLADTDCYIQRSNLLPLEGTKQSLNVVDPPALDPKGYVPDWRSRGTCAPFYNPRTGKYCATVSTEYTSLSFDDTESAIRSEALLPGVEQLLEYFSRSTLGCGDLAEAAEFLLNNSYYFAEVEQIYLSPNPGSTAKALVTVPAQYFDAIPKFSCPPIIPKSGIRTVLLNTYTLESDFKLLIKTLKQITPKLQGFTGTIVGFKPSREAIKLGKILPALKELIRVNGFDFRADFEDMIEIAVDADFKPLQVVLYVDGLGHKLDIGFNAFKSSTGVNLPRTMHYVLQMHNMLSFIRAQKFKTTAFDWLRFSTLHTFPALEIRFTSQLTPGLNLKQIQTDAKIAMDKFNGVPFKDFGQMQFEMGKLNDPDFLKNMSLARANISLPSGDNILLQLPDLLDEIGSLDDLFGKFLGKVEIPKLIQMAMSSVMANMSFPDLFEAMLSAILKQLSIEVIIEQIVAKLDFDIQVSIFEDLIKALDLPAECYCAIFDQINLSTESLTDLLPAGTITVSTGDSETTTTEGITYSDEDTCDKTIEEVAAQNKSSSAGCSYILDIDTGVLATALVTMAVEGVAEKVLDAPNLTKDRGRYTEELSGGNPTGSVKYPRITPARVKKALFAVVEECSGFDVSEIIGFLSDGIKGQISAGSLDIDTLKDLPVISASFDALMLDPSLNLNMEIPQLGGLSLEMPSINMELGSIDIPSLKIPTITLPEIPTFDLMGMVFQGIEIAVKTAITEALIAMAKTVIEGLLSDFDSGLGDLSFGEANIGDLLGASLGSINAASESISMVFEPLGISANGEVSFTEEEISSALSACGPATPAGESGTPEDFLDEVSEALNITEVENLLNGNPSPNACTLIGSLVQSGYNNMAPAFDDCSKIAETFAEIGEMVKPELIQNLKPPKTKIANKLEYLCKEAQPFDEEPYKDVMRAKGLTDEEIEEQLQQEKDVQKQALEDLASLLAEVQADDVLSGLVPPVFPEECGAPSLMPADSEIPEMNMVNEMIVDSVLTGTKMAWKTESDLYFESFLSGSEEGEIIPLIYDGPTATRAVINPKFTTMLSSGFPLCDSEGNVYTDADDLAACKFLIDSPATQNNPEVSLTKAIMLSDEAEELESGDINEYANMFLYTSETMNRWFDKSLDEDPVDGEQSWFNVSKTNRYNHLWGKVNVLRSDLSQSVNSEIRDAYDTNSYSTGRKLNCSYDGLMEWTAVSWTEDVRFAVVGEGIETVYRVPLSDAAPASNSKSGATVEVSTEASCVAPMESCPCQPTAPTTPSYDFEPGAPKPYQVFTQMVYSAFSGSFGHLFPIKANTLDGTEQIYIDDSNFAQIQNSQQAGFLSYKKLIEYKNIAGSLYDQITPDFIMNMKIEPLQKEGCEPTFVLDPDGAKSDAMDAINGKCPKPPSPSEKSPVAEGTLVGVINLTLRAYIADIMLRSAPLLTKLPVTKPSEILKNYIYSDMVFDMNNISPQYYADFFSETIKIYNEREDAISGLTDYQVFSILIEEQFAKVVPALAKNLGAEYTDIHRLNVETELAKTEEDPSITGTGIRFLDTADGLSVYFDQQANTDTGLRYYSQALVNVPYDSTKTKSERIAQLIATEEYQTIYDYCIPLNDLASLLHVHIGKQTTINSPTVQTAFDSTKEELKKAFDVLYYGPEMGLAHAVGPTSEQAAADAENNTGTQLGEFADDTNMAKIMKKMVINTVPTMIKGLAEQLDPNIKRSKLVRNAATKVGVSMHPVAASMSLLPMNIIPPIFGGFGPPVGPLGFMYWALAKPDKIEKRVIEQAGQNNESAITPDSSTDATVDNSECNPSEET